MPPLHIAVVNNRSRHPDREIAFEVAAVAIQLREHVAPLWDGEPPGLQFYGTAEHAPGDKAAVLGYVNDDGNADSAGYHTAAGRFVYGLIDVGQSHVPSVTLSHEGCEMYGNPHLDRKVVGKNGRAYFLELNDPVQRQTYFIEVTLFGETRQVEVADFVLPSWFGLPQPAAAGTRTTYLGQRLAPFEIAPGGYQIAEEPDGGIVFLASAGGAGGASLRRSKHSRTMRIVDQLVGRALAPLAAATAPPAPARGRRR
jgi:hypothetical protein